MSKRKRDSGPDIRLPSASPFEPVIAQAYEVFSGPTPNDTETCDCCMEDWIRKDFFNHRSQDLPLYYIRDWFFAAVEDPISTTLWQFLLPRILEILACGEDPASVALEVSFSRFPTGERARWSEAQWKVLEEFRVTYLDYYDGFAEVNMLDDVLCMFGEAGWPLEPMMKQVLGWPDDVLVKRLWRDWASWGTGHRSIWITAFWKDEAAARARWTSKELEARLLEIGMAEKTPRDIADKALILTEIVLDRL